MSNFWSANLQGLFKKFRKLSLRAPCGGEAIYLHMNQKIRDCVVVRRTPRNDIKRVKLKLYTPA